MRSLAEYYNAYEKRGDVGIEIECEGNAPLPVIEEKNWRTHADASLRGHSAEYVTAQPVVITAVNTTLDNLSKKLKGAAIVDSFRTSVHVHKNLLKYSPLQIWNAVCAYWIIEEMLFNYCGKHRIGSTFCLRLKDAEAVLDACLYDLSTDYPFRSFKNNDDIRYSGANLAAVRKFGTVEFRGMRGTIDPLIIGTWCKELSNLVDHAAIQFDSPEELLDTFHNIKEEDFLSRFLSFNFTETLMKDNKDWKQSLQDGAERVLPLAYAHDWKSWVKKMEDGFEKKIFKGTISADPDPRQVFNIPPVQRVRWGVVNPIAGVGGVANVIMDNFQPIDDDF